MDNAERRQEIERLRAASNDAKRHTRKSKEAVVDSIKALHRAGDLLDSPNPVRVKPERTS
jgi:hypothetical protein